MASDSDEFDKNIENLKATVKKSFALVYATLKARELKTLRQLDAIRKQCQNDQYLMRTCNRNIEINYNNKSTLLDNVNNFGAIDFEKLNLDSNTFTLEDYVSPEVDHMYSYKTIEELTKEVDNGDLEAIEEAALRQITANDDCICYVNIRTEDVSKRFRDIGQTSPEKTLHVTFEDRIDSKEIEHVEDEKESESEKSESSDIEIKKIEPTDEWLNTIKSQTETEPTQVTDVMEHSTITCS